MNGRTSKYLRKLAQKVTVEWPNKLYVYGNNDEIILGRCTRKVYLDMKRKHKAKMRGEHYVAR